MNRSALRPREQAVLRAFSQALLPGGEDLPAAELTGGVRVVAPVDAAVGRAGSRARIAIRLALAAFEWTTFPHRFSSLSLERRSAHLARLDDRGKGLAYELLSTLKSLASLGYANDETVQRALGVRAVCERADAGGPATSAPRLSAEQMETPEGAERCDVAVVGSGAGGASVARVLAEAGLSVIVVEEGNFYDHSTYSTDTFESTGSLYRDGGLTVCEGRPAIPMPIGRCVGGTTVINSGTCFRAPDDVLIKWRDLYGIDWATDLDGEFEALERDLHVTPVDPATAGRNAELCRVGAEAIGASNGPIRRNAGNVACCSSCPNGCALDAKQAAHVSELPRAVAAGCRIRAGAKVQEVLFEHGRATGVRCRTGRGRYEVRAPAVVLAAGAVGTPELLLAQGVSDLSGQIGRNLRIHPACWVGARYEDEVRGWEGVMQSWYVDQWRDRGLFLEATFTPFAFGLHWLPGTGEQFERRISQYGDMAIIGVHMSDRASQGRVSVSRAGRVRISYRLSSADAHEIRFGIARAAQMHLAAGAGEVFPQLAGVSSIRSGRELEAIERGPIAPADLRLEAFHPMGTVRMGAERSSSVLSPSGESHELQGLYVADGSIFPTSLGVNPMITIMACARRIASGIADRLA